MKTVTSQAIVAILVLTSCLTINCQAQTSVDNKRLVMPLNDSAFVAIHNQKAQRFLFEFSGGPALCTSHGTELPGKFPLLRYTIALGASYRLSEKLDIDARLLWEAKGIIHQYWGPDYDGMYAKVHQGFELDYITLTPTISYYVDCDRRLFIAVGLSVSRLVQGNAFTYYYVENDELTDSFFADASDTFKKFDLGATAIIGYRRQVSRKVAINAQLFGNLGFIHIFSEPHNRPFRNANLALLLGITIPYH